MTGELVRFFNLKHKSPIMYPHPVINPAPNVWLREVAFLVSVCHDLFPEYLALPIENGM